MLRWLAAIGIGVAVGSVVAVWFGACIMLGMYGAFSEFTAKVTTELERLESLIERAIESKWN